MPFDKGELKIIETKAFSDGERAAVKCYGANDVLEGVAIMKEEGVDVSITVFHSLFNRYCCCNCCTYHWVVTHTDKTHPKLQNFAFLGYNIIFCILCQCVCTGFFVF